MAEQWLTVPEAAARLHVSADVVYRLAKGRVLTSRREGRAWRVSAWSVDAHERSTLSLGTASRMPSSGESEAERALWGNRR